MTSVARGAVIRLDDFFLFWFMDNLKDEIFGVIWNATDRLRAVTWSKL